MARRQVSAAAWAQAQELTPILAEMIEQHDPCLQGLDFNQIEANAAAIGAVLARLLMRRAVQRQADPTPEEEQGARQQALQQADAKLSRGRRAEELKMVRARGKRRKLKTMRGEVELARTYLYFPELKTGIFPPRPTAQTAR
jgi:hypothetical protein